MAYTLYCLRNSNGNITFGIKPYDPKYASKYASMFQPLSIKTDLKWNEVTDFQRICRMTDFWEDFPLAGVTLVTAEKKVGDEEQRIDLLYLKEDGSLLPCELKLGGESKDTHGQLIRYISDLAAKQLKLADLEKLNSDYVSTITDETAKEEQENKFKEFIKKHSINTKPITIFPTGIIIDESFKPQLVTAVRYLNNQCGFGIRLVSVKGFAEKGWSSQSDLFFKLEFIDTI